MINVKFYSFSKKENSTKVPTSPVVPSAEYSCLLKDGSGVISPELEIATSANVSAWNYCYIPDFGRYYFVSEWTYDNGQWIAKLTMDVLASWRYEISQSNQYILRSSYEYDNSIMDNYYPAKAQPSVSTVIPDTGTALYTSFSTAARTYVVGIINNDSASQIGCVSYYAMTPTQIGTMKSLLLTDNNWIGNVDAGATAVQISKSKVDINPFQYIVSCKWFPITVPTSDNTPVSNIRTGWWASNLEGYHLYDDTSWMRSYDVTIPKHPQQSGRGVWVNSGNTASYMLDFAGFHINLDSNLLFNAASLHVELYFDFISGMGDLKIYADATGGQRWLVSESFQEIGVNIPLAQVTYSSEGLANTPIYGAVFKAAEGIGNTIGGAIVGSKGMEGWNYSGNSFWNSVGNMMGFNQITSSFSAGSGGIGAIRSNPKPRITAVFQPVVDEDLASAGRPLCKNRTISTIPGFIVCNHVELAIPATEQEIVAIKNYMEGGFFYE